MLRVLLPLTLLFPITAIAEEGIREFPIETIVSLGKELYRRDQMAAKATDLVLAAHPDAKKLRVVGWITQADKEAQRVYLIQEIDGQPALAYTVTFPDEGKPKIEDAKGAELPEFVAKRFAARQAAIKAIPHFFAKRYNFEVLDAPDGKGFLVYGLAATTEEDKIVVGGHYRVTVSEGGRPQQVDALSRSLLELPKQPKELPEDSKPVGQVVTHIVSKTPVETHVFVSLLHKTPLYVVTSETDVWMVDNGAIVKHEEPKQDGKGDVDKK